MTAWPKMPSSGPATAGIPRDIVMMVDDNGDELAMLSEAMAHAGFGTLSANSGTAALDLLERAMPNLIVLDAVMPGLDGFETCRRIKAETRFAHLPVIFMTGLKAPEDIVRGLESGGVDYVTKPVNIAELLARVRIHIANGRVAFGARVALDATGRYLLATDGTGQARWTTPQAGSLLADAFDQVNAADVKLPEALVPLVRRLIQAAETEKPQPVPGSDMAIAFLGRNGPDEYLFRLTLTSAGGEEGVLRAEFALTTREAEVLLWIARGKANKEISDILLISPRTVNKHLERVFAKLGVENRASAASLAMRTLAARG
jgi:DNA-binding response OmpR family regulator/DNA-binding CsgD family transcriptional regulator